MKFLKHILTILGLMFCLSTMAQTDSLKFVPIEPIKTIIKKNNNIIKELNIGDKVPDYEFKNPLVNYGHGKTKLSEFKGKLVIVAIWSLGCASCIEGFPKLQTLQEEFNDQIQILLVNPWGNKKEIETLLKSREKITGFKMKLPIAFGDIEFYDWFTVNGSINGVPHFVWIKDDEIISVTYGNSINSKNIKAVLNGEKTNMPQKTIKLIERDMDLPLFINGNGGNGNELLWHSMLSKRIEGLPAGSYVTTDSSDVGSKAWAVNFPIRSLLSVAYGTPRHPFYYNYLFRVPRGRIKLEVSDTSKYLSKVKGGENKNENIYTYELQSSVYQSEEKLLKMMQEDLKRYFSVDVKWEKRNVRCLVLKMTDSTLLNINPIVREHPKIWRNSNKMTVNIENSSADRFVFWLEKSSSLVRLHVPILNETGYSGNITGVEFTGIDEKDWKSWNSKLREIGLEFEMAYRDVDILVVREL